MEQFLKQFDKEIQLENVHKIGRNYYLTNTELLSIKDSIHRDIFSLGIFLGEKKEKFYPSPALIDMISKKTTRKVYVNKKAEWLFLCGRNILQESIIKNPLNLKEDFVFVQNEQDENLGYGIFHQQGRDLVIKNLLDKGKYLRYNEKGRR